MRKPVYYLAPILVAGMVWLGFKVCDVLTTDQKKVRKIILKTAQAVKDRKAGKAVKYLSHEFRDLPTGADPRSVRQFFAFLFYKNVPFEMSYSQEYLTVREDSAAAAFKVTFNSPDGTPILNWNRRYADSRICVFFIKEGSKWKIRATDQKDFFR